MLETLSCPATSATVTKRDRDSFDCTRKPPFSALTSVRHGDPWGKWDTREKRGSATPARALSTVLSRPRPPRERRASPRRPRALASPPRSSRPERSPRRGGFLVPQLTWP